MFLLMVFKSRGQEDGPIIVTIVIDCHSGHMVGNWSCQLLIITRDPVWPLFWVCGVNQKPGLPLTHMCSVWALKLTTHMPYIGGKRLKKKTYHGQNSTLPSYGDNDDFFPCKPIPGIPNSRPSNFHSPL